EFTLPQNIGAFTVIKRPVSFCLVFHYAFDNFLHRKPKHRPASFPPPPLHVRHRKGLPDGFENA
ncbi:MAG: hypothetical protein SPK44_00800, partial [Oscillospiraceae bacterium]|nr:hypothetical protein [Oscillospiraceae bacterium]